MAGDNKALIREGSLLLLFFNISFLNFLVYTFLRGDQEDSKKNYYNF